MKKLNLIFVVLSLEYPSDIYQCLVENIRMYNFIFGKVISIEESVKYDSSLLNP